MRDHTRVTQFYCHASKLLHLCKYCVDWANNWQTKNEILPNYIVLVIKKDAQIDTDSVNSHITNQEQNQIPVQARKKYMKNFQRIF